MEDLQKTIILFKGRIQTLDYKIDRFVQYLDSVGVKHYVVDVSKDGAYNDPELKRFLNQPGCVMFTYNNVGIDVAIDGDRNLWESLNIPVYTFLVDNPRYYEDALLNPFCDTNVICCDKDHVEFVKEFYPKVKKVFFMPQGGTEKNSKCPASKRSVDVIYMGTNKKFLGFQKIPFFRDGGEEFYIYCAKKLFDMPNTTIQSAVNSYLEDMSPELTDKEKYDLQIKYAGDVEDYVRREFKFRSMHALDDAGIHVEIYGGDSWIDEEQPFSDNIVIHDKIPIRDLLDKLGNAKISLCFIPWFKRGATEKNFDSMLNGALCVTDESEYLRERYFDGKNIIYFDLNNPQQMAADVKWLLDHPDVLDEIAMGGYITARQFDSWDIRYHEIFELICREL